RWDQMRLDGATTTRPAACGDPASQPADTSACGRIVPRSGRVCARYELRGPTGLQTDGLRFANFYTKLHCRRPRPKPSTAVASTGVRQSRKRIGSSVVSDKLQTLHEMPSPSTDSEGAPTPRSLGGPDDEAACANPVLGRTASPRGQQPRSSCG